MPRELITIQVGQCGNQVGRRFWEMALAEHAAHNPEGIFDEAMSTFFRNVDARYPDAPDLPFANGRSHISGLRARAVLVDMEEGPVSETLRGPLGELFDSRQYITDVSGAGNNFAHGFSVYGPQYREGVDEAIRRAAELCDSLQSFFIMHSLGGGTGSGLGSYILTTLHDDYPEVHRFSTAIFPSEDDDVVTSPYNSVLALQQLTEHADCVLPVENQSLIDIRDQMQPSPGESTGHRAQAAATKAVPQHGFPALSQASGGGAGRKRSRAEGFQDMNAILARLLINLTASMRFAGDLNVDLNEITTNLVPYPRLHYLTSSLSPLVHERSSKTVVRTINASHQLKHICSGAFARRNQLLRSDPRSGTMLACALLFRGKDISVSDVTANVQRLQSEMKMIYWNREGFKIGLCSVPPLEQPDSPSVLGLSNNCGIAETLSAMESRFQRLYSRRAMLHHYTQYMDGEGLVEARDDLRGLINEYKELQHAQPPAANTTAMRRSRPLF